MTTNRPSCLAIAADVRARRRSAVETTHDALAHIEQHNPAINAFTEVFPERALARAAAIDAALARGESPGPLAGVPIAVKDNIATAFGRTTCGSNYLRDYRSPFSATAVERLEAAGAVVVGKTNLDEFGMGSSTEHSIHGATRNPHDAARSAGGSSGGSAAAVAAGLVPAALGSDTGGSVRQPAGFCGIAGIKPTYGRVSRYGLVAYASSLDQIGVLAATTADAAAVLSVISGHDERDMTSAAAPPPALAPAAAESLAGLRIGVVALGARAKATNSPGVSSAIDFASAALAARGACISTATLDRIDAGIAAYYVIAPAEASSNLARFDGVRYGRRAELSPTDGLEAMFARSRAEGFGAEVRRRIMLGTHVLSSGYYDAYYLTALRARRLIRDDFNRALSSCDALLMPVTPGPPFPLGAHQGDPIAMYLEDVYTVGVSLAGLPAVVVQGAWETVGPARLPIGVQLVGRAMDEATLLRLASAVESAFTASAASARG